MKERLAAHFASALESLGLDSAEPAPAIELSRPKKREFGDWSCNIAMRLAAQHGDKPRAWAERVVAGLAPMPEVREWRIAGPGFINVHLHEASRSQAIIDIHEQQASYGCRAAPDDAPRTLLEFLSTNPTGPLHVGHGRIAVFGSALFAILKAAGHNVSSEFYINDAGRQIDILGLSALIRGARAALAGNDARLKEIGLCQDWGLYQGDYLDGFGRALSADAGLAPDWPARLAGLVKEAVAQAGSPEGQIDACLRAVATALGEPLWPRLRAQVAQGILDDIKDDLVGSRVVFDSWFSESELRPGVEEAVQAWRAHPDSYERDGALWFAATRHGDDKDRVLLRHDGTPTYFAMDLLYHASKIGRGHQRLINVLGSDHHGYLTRLRSAVEVFSAPPRPVEAVLVQFVRLHEGGAVVQMSTRSGQFVSLRELRARIGADALRFYFLLSEADQGLDFDLKLVVQQSLENPLYYVQYAAVRCQKVLDKACSRGMALDIGAARAHLGRLEEPSERELIGALAQYPEAIGRAADKLEPAILLRYLRGLAAQLHSCYGAVPFIVDEAGLCQARLMLVSATRTVLANALGLLSITVPEQM